MEKHTHREEEHFFGAAKVIAGITVLSRILGLVRDILIVSFGANRATDSFWTAFRVPNVFRRLFGEGALSAAFVPVFTEVAERQGWDKARSILANCFGLLALLLAGIVVIVELVLAGFLIFAPGPWDRMLLIQLTMLVVPFMITICLLALGSAAMNCKGHFAYPAFAPIMLNIFLIAGAWAAHHFFGGGQWQGLFLLAISSLLAGVAQVVGVFWLLARAKLAAMPVLAPIGPEVRRIAALALPMMLPLGLTQLTSLFESFYAWLMSATDGAPSFTVFSVTIAKPLQAGIVTCVYAAERLYNFPLGILAVSVATAVFPLFSRYAARGDMAGLRDVTGRALRLSLFLGIPSGVALIVLAKPAIMLIYRHGQFSDSDAGRAALILKMYCLGMWAYFARGILLRAFFCRKDVKTPLKISCWLTAVNILLVAALVFTPLRGAGIGLATAITASANALLLTWALRRRWGALGLAEIARSVVRTLLASGLMAGAMLAAMHYVAAAAAASAFASGLLVAAGTAAGIAVFFGSAMFMRSPELRELMGALKPTAPDGDGPQE